MASGNDISEMVRVLRKGDEATSQHLFSLVYDELRRLAQYHLNYERADHTINATALVHETFLKLVDRPSGVSANDRAHFVALASRAMRRILTDYARTRNRIKRGGGASHESLENAVNLPVENGEDLILLEQALSRLEQLNPQHCRIVECRYLGGLSIEETAVALELSESSVKRGWRAARAFLYNELFAGKTRLDS